MDDNYEGDSKNTIQCNLVPKVEPNDGDFDLCGEYVDGVPQASTSPPPYTMDVKDPLSGRTADYKPYGLKDLKIVIKDCFQELATMKADVKSEPEENIYDDTEEYQHNDDPYTAELNAENQETSILPSKMKVSNRKKREYRWVPQRHTDVLPENILPPSKKGRRKVSYNYENTSSSESDNDKSYNPKRGLTATTSRPSRVKQEKTIKGKRPPSNTPPDKQKLFNDSPHNTNNTFMNPQSNSSLLMKTVLATEKEKNSSSVKNKLTNDSPYIMGNTITTPQSNLSPMTDLVTFCNSVSATEKEEERSSVNKALLVESVLWSCCNMKFELFSSYNEHKVQVHLMEELKCAVCIDKYFTSIEEMEKHYLDAHTDSSWKSFHCLDCKLVFGVKSSYFDHKKKCSESQRVCSGILDSIIDFAVTREKQNNVEVDEDTPFKLSCCENIFENFEDFVFHKVSDHSITLLTCGLCMCVNNSETQLRSHYRKFHFKKFWNRLELKKHRNIKEGAASTQPSSTQEDEVLNEEDNGSSDRDEARAKSICCSALRDGILCQCCDCTKLVEGTKPVNSIDTALKKPFVCEPCNLRFRYKSRLEKHLKTHGGVKLFPCDICGSAFTLLTSLKTHKLYKHSHKHSSNSFQDACSICDKVFLTKSALKRHFSKVHMHINIKFTCEHCGKILSTSSSYFRHINVVHIKDKQFICDYCNRIYYDKRTLVTHMQVMHLSSEKYECKKCDRPFKTRLTLDTHNKRVHSDCRQFNCEVCGKVFKAKRNLMVHIAAHSDETPFICQICGKGFKRDMNLEQHQHSHSDSRPHACNFCGKTFKLRTHVKQHMAVHGVAKNHKCFICEKAFARKAELNSHLPSHGV